MMLFYGLYKSCHASQLQNMLGIWVLSDFSPALSRFPLGTSVLLNDAKQKMHTNGSQNESWHYCFSYLGGPKLQKLIHCKAMRALNLLLPYITFHITLEHGEINCRQGREDRKNL